MIGYLPLVLPILLGIVAKVYDNQRKLKRKKHALEREIQLKGATHRPDIPDHAHCGAGPFTQRSLSRDPPRGKISVVSMETHPPNNFESPHSKSEERCRRVMERLYGVKFPPYEQFVINPRTGRWLTLDGYNPNLKLAFEYQGPQHYDFPNYLSRQGRMTKQQFEQGLWRDRYKKMACKRAGIRLLRIPHTEDRNLIDYIKSIAPGF